MRFALAVAAGALVLGLLFLRMPNINDPLFSMAWVILAALATGFFAAKRGALAGFLIVYVGNLIFVLANLMRFGVGQDSGGVPGFVGRLLMVQVVLLQYAIPAAIAGWVGAYARRRMVGGGWR